MGRPATAEINLSALRHNFRLARALTKKKIMSVIKADAYGHGAIPVGRVLEQEGTDGLAVACIEEALALREAGIQSPLLLLQGFYENSELPLIAEHRMTPVIHQAEQVQALTKWQGAPLNIWLKLDTGMHRLGFLPHEMRAAYQTLSQSPAVRNIVLMTHFSSADEPANPSALMQTKRFLDLTSDLPEETCLSNSAAVLSLSMAAGHWIRPGLLLYGASPFSCPHTLADNLQPVMRVTSAIFAIRELEAGAPVGYGQTYVTRQAARIGVVAIGYADGYPRAAPSGTPVLVGKHRTHLCGRVSMDMLTIDLTSLPHVRVGDPVTLWGGALSATEVANKAGTIPYELFCNLKRVPMKYTDPEAPPPNNS
ncbi:MAG: alanine racemase [Kistimonas sp.]|nr:alanine racemase [Kistimonas sp.]